MFKRGRWLVFGVVLLVCASGSAQTTGAIQGQVNDNDGKALPGVTVTLSGEPIQGGERSAVTDDRGGFKFGALPVGRYTLSATLAGFKSQKVENVRVTIDGTSSMTFAMQTESFAGEIAVTGEAPLVDTVSTSVSTNYDAEFVKSLPTRNNFYDIISVSPAVSAPNEGNGLFAAYGGNVTSQQWNIDGLNLASPEGGWLGWNINPDLVAETSIKGFGAGAEYGSTMGNVYNLVTKSGTNQFHGSAAAYMQFNSLVDPNINLDTSNLPDYRLWDPAGEYTIDDYYDVRLTLGGPIVRDHLWFFAGYQTDDVNLVGPTGVAGLDGSGTTEDRYDLKLTWQIATGNRIDVRGHKGKTNIVPAPDMYTALSAVVTYDIDIDMLTADYNGILSENTLLNLRAGTWSKNQDMASRTGSEEEWLQDNTYSGPPLNLGGIFWFSGRKEEYTQVDAVVSHFADEFIAGNHQLKFGVQYNEGSGARNAAKSSFVWKQPPSAAYWWYDYWAFRFIIDPPIVYGADTTTFGVFAEDSWQITDSLTIDLGVRWDDQKGEIPPFPLLDENGDPTGETLPGADMIHWQNWAPRLGFAWDPGGQGRTVLRGFAGLYYDGPVSSAWYYPPPGRGPAQVYFLYPWQFLVSSVDAPPPDELLDPDVKNPYTWQYGLSFDQQIGSNYAVGAQFVLKNTRDIIGWQIEDDGYCEPFLWDDPWTEDVVEQIQLCDTIVNPTLRKGNAPGPGSLAPDASYYVDYQGAILTFRKRYTNGWDLMASYTYSKTEGINPLPHDNGSLGQGLPTFSADSGSDPNDWYNADHLLNGDRTHMFRIQSNVDVGWDVRLSGVLNLQSGRPYLRLAQVVAPYTGTALTVTVDDSESLRLPSQAILDLGAQKTFKLGGDVALDIGLQVLNVFNEDAVEYWASWVLFAGQDFTPADWVSPRRLQLKVAVNF
jgi:hypothetical protein